LVSLRGGDSIVLDVHNWTRQVSEGREQSRYVSGVLPNRRLVENVQHVLEAAGQSYGQPYPLGLAT